MECPSRVWQLHKYIAALPDCSLCTSDYMRKKKNDINETENKDAIPRGQRKRSSYLCTRLTSCPFSNGKCSFEQLPSRMHSLTLISYVSLSPPLFFFLSSDDFESRTSPLQSHPSCRSSVESLDYCDARVVAPTLHTVTCTKYSWYFLVTWYRHIVPAYECSSLCRASSRIPQAYK